jgi:hypothetical protein
VLGELRPYFGVLEAYANAIVFGALDYAVNGNEAALASARRAMLTATRWQTWTPPRFASHGSHTYYQAGIFGQRVALGYDLIAPRLAVDERREIAGALRRHVIEPTLKEYFLYDRMPTAASNWMAISVGGAIAAAVAVDGDDPAADAYGLPALTTAFERALDGLFPGDGSEAEPAGYHNFALQGFSWGMVALDAVGVRPRTAAKMLDGFWWSHYAMVDPGLVLDTGDFPGHFERLTGFAWVAEHSGSAVWRDFYSRARYTLEQSAAVLDLVCSRRLRRVRRRCRHRAYSLTGARSSAVAGNARTPSCPRASARGSITGTTIRAASRLPRSGTS